MSSQIKGTAPAESTGFPSVPPGTREGRRLPFISGLLVWIYGKSGERIRGMLRWFVTRQECGELYSLTLREIFTRYHGVEIGLFTAGAPFVPRAFPPGTRIGRFCSIFWTTRAFNANHPMNLKSTHALFYNPALGFVSEDLITRPPLEIEADVLIGHNAIILPSVRKIGVGAVIGAGSVVHENVPPYAVVVGHPARVVRYRFSKETIADLINSRWWENDLATLRFAVDDFRVPLDGEKVR